MPILADQPGDGLLRCLIWRFLSSHPSHAASAETLRQEVDRAAAADGSASLELAAQECAGMDLRELVRRAQRSGAVAEPPAPAAAPETALPSWLLQREAGRWWSSRSPRTALAASAALQFGPDRFGLRGVVEGHLAAAYCVTCDQAGQRILTGADDGLVKIWCARTCLLLGALRGHRGEITELTLSSPAAGTLLASSSNDGDVRVWDLDAPGIPCVAVLRLSEPAAPVAGTRFRPARPACPLQLLTVSAAGTLALWTQTAGQLGATADATDAEAEAGGATSVAGFPAADTHGWLPAWTRTPVKSADGYIVFEGAWSPGGARFAVGTTDEVVHVYRVPPPTSPAFIPNAGAPLALPAPGAPAAQLGAALSAPQLVATLRGHRHDVTSLCWSSCGSALLSGSKDGTARVWRLKGPAGTGRVLGSTPSLVSYPGERWSSSLLGETPWTLDNPAPSGLPVIGAVAWSADDALIVTSRSDARLFVWCGRTGAALRELALGPAEPAHSREVYVLKCHPSLPHVAVSASYDGSAVVWDLRTGLPLRVVRQPVFDDDTELLDGQWAPDGDLFAMTDTGGRLSVWGGSLSAATPAAFHQRLDSGEVRASGATCLAASAVAPLQQFYSADLAPAVAGAAPAPAGLDAEPFLHPGTAAPVYEHTLVDKMGRAYADRIQEAAAGAARAALASPANNPLALQAAEDRHRQEQRLLDDIEARGAVRPQAKRQPGVARPPPALACERAPVAALAEPEELCSQSEGEDRDADYGELAAEAGETDGDTEGDTDGELDSDDTEGGSGRGLSRDDWALTAATRGGRRVTRSSRGRPQEPEGRKLRRRATGGNRVPTEASASGAATHPQPHEPRRRLVRTSDAVDAGQHLAGLSGSAPSGPARRASTVAAEQRLQVLRASGILGDDSDAEPKPKRRRRGGAAASKAKRAVTRAGQRKPRRRVASSSEEEEDDDELESQWDSAEGSEPGESEAGVSEGEGSQAGSASGMGGERPVPRRAARRVVDDDDDEEVGAGEAAEDRAAAAAEGKAAAAGEEPHAGGATAGPSGSEDEYEVESIVARRERRGQREYLVQWKGFGDDANTWEPEASLAGCEERMREFREAMAQRAGKGGASAAGEGSADARAGGRKRRTRGRD